MHLIITAKFGFFFYSIFLFHLYPSAFNCTPVSTITLPLTYFSCFLRIFLSGQPVLLLAADIPPRQDVGVAEPQAEPRVARRRVSHVQGDRLVAVVQFEGGDQQGEVQIKVGPLGVVPELFGVEIQHSLPSSSGQ